MAKEPEGWRIDKRSLLLSGEEALGFSEIVLSGHAQDRMKQRGISVEDVLTTLRSPTRTGLPTQPGRRRFRLDKTSRTAIDVVHMVIADRLLIVTVIKITKPTRRRGKR